MTYTSAKALPAPPLAPEKTQLAAELARGLDVDALTWLSGYMAGAAAQLHDQAATAAPALATRADPGIRLTVLYGSQTGNAKRIAEQLADQAKTAGLSVRLLPTSAYRSHELKNERLLYVVISTHSAGDAVQPPDDARGFMEFLMGRRAPRLPDLRFSVLALGDTSYPDFCAIGRSIDERLDALGATRLQRRGEADVDIDRVAAPWLRAALEHAATALGEASATALRAPTGVVTPLHPVTQTWSRERPFAAELLVNQRIVASDSGKDVRHIELSLQGSGIHYQPGDALGVWPKQATELVSAVLAELALDGEQAVEYDGERINLRQWLGERRELTTLTRPFLAAHAELGNHLDLAELLQPEARAKRGALLASHQVLDVLRRWPARWEAGALVAALRPLAPRLYSIASSQQQVGDEVHLTVARWHGTHDDEARWGVATQHLCALAEGDTVPVFIETNERFRLPADAETDVIMIGPGTGVAPFRAFVQERQIVGAPGRQWLFFGNPQRRTDFLYQLEWQQALRDGALTRLSVAFSRDQAGKLYVQDRLREHGRELWSWLEGGAHLYVCGDAERMAPDVHAALAGIVAEHGGMSRGDADALLNQWLTEGRYARDVY